MGETKPAQLHGASSYLIAGENAEYVELSVGSKAQALCIPPRDDACHMRPVPHGIFESILIGPICPFHHVVEVMPTRVQS